MKFDNMSDLPLPSLEGIQGMPIREKDFSGQKFDSPPTGTHFVDCNFSTTQWLGIPLEGVVFIRCRFDGSHFEICDLKQVRFFSCSCDGLQLRQTKILECHWEGGQWSACEAMDCRFMSVIFNEVAFSNWTFTNCDIAYLTLSRLQAEGFNVERSRVSDMSLVESVVNGHLWCGVAMDRVMSANSVLRNAQWLDCQGINNRWMGIEGEGMVYRACAFRQSAWSMSKIKRMHFSDNTLHVAYFDQGVFDELALVNNRIHVLAFDRSVISDSSFDEPQLAYLSFREARLEACDLRKLKVNDFDARGCFLRNCRVDGADFKEANMTGQEPELWQGANVNFARFEASEAQIQDLAWWKSCRPGAGGGVQ